MFAKYLGENKYGNDTYIVVCEDGTYWFIERRALKRMPYSRWDQGIWGYVHATGYECFNWATRKWEVEYEDSPSYELIMGAV